MLNEQVHVNDMEGLVALSKTPEGLVLLEENASAWMKKIYSVSYLLIFIEIFDPSVDYLTFPSHLRKRRLLN